MDRTEVTNAEYAELCATLITKALPIGSEESIGWSGTVADCECTARDAEAFAAWRRKRDGVAYRLPTEDRGVCARNGVSTGLSPGKHLGTEPRGVKEQSAASGQLSGRKESVGRIDLIGNASEWTSSKASVYTGAAQIPPENKIGWSFEAVRRKRSRQSTRYQFPLPTEIGLIRS